ncbi:hypothetical protein [Arthrobacter sp. KBS0702]|uniref:hypothetical protein n=1 Tax=Arthrobacter sp. KBS0702 TaxID=2578107 RepID=UPI0037BFB1AA
MARRGGWRRRIVLLLAVAMVAGAIYTAVEFLQRSETLITERCTAVGSGGDDLATDQAANAALISAIAVRRGLPARAASIALATSMQESKLRNIGHGDQAGPDSRGLFQQRPSQGWGTEQEVMDPYHATNAFYDALETIPGYESLPITEAAQQVQRSAYPGAYAQHEGMARAFASALTGHTAQGLDCSLRMPDAAGDPAQLQQRLAAAFGPIPATAAGRTVMVTAQDTRSWAVAHWAVANAKALSISEVRVAGQTWTRSSHNGWQAGDAPSGQVAITVAGKPAP